MIIYNRFFSWILEKYYIRAITIYPFIFLRYKKDKNNLTLINHEKIHLKQEKELFIIPFYIKYILEYNKLCKKMDSYSAYLFISFENEAYTNENNLNYLENRDKHAYKKYIYKK